MCSQRAKIRERWLRERTYQKWNFARFATSFLAVVGTTPSMFEFIRGHENAEKKVVASFMHCLIVWRNMVNSVFISIPCNVSWQNFLFYATPKSSQKSLTAIHYFSRIFPIFHLAQVKINFCLWWKLKSPWQ